MKIVGITLVTLGAALLAFVIGQLVRAVRRVVIARVPLDREERVELQPGTVVLALEGPMGRRFPKVHPRLRDPSGADLPLTRDRVPSKVGGSGRVRFSLMRGQVIRTGTHQLSCTIEGEHDPQLALVVARPARATIALHVFGILVCVAITVGGIFALTGPLG